MTTVSSPSRRDFLRTAPAGVAAFGTTFLGSAMSGEPPAPRIIDPHVHVWKNDAKYPWPKELARPPKEDALPSTLSELMKANGVEKTVIVHVIHYKWDCRYAGDTIKAQRDKFMGVGQVDPTADSAVEDLNHWVKEYRSEDRKSTRLNSSHT